MRLRPRVVDDVLRPFAVAHVLEPAEAVVVRHGRENVRAVVPIDVEDVHAAEVRTARDGGNRCSRGRSAGGYRMLVPVCGMESPFARGTRICRRFQPTLGREDVISPVAIQISRANSVAVALRTDDMLYPFAA